MTKVYKINLFNKRIRSEWELGILSRILSLLWLIIV